MINNIFLYISSRNNYDMLLHEVIPTVNFDGLVINVDDNSCDQEKEKGRAICEEYGITFMENNGVGLYMAANTAIKYCRSNYPDVKYAYWLTHDCLPMKDDMFDMLSKLVDSSKLDPFGCVGFNTVWRKFSYSKEDFIEQSLFGKYCGAMGRAVLTRVPGAGWYRSSDFEMKWDVWGKNMAVESVVDMNLMINVSKFIDYIKPDESFRHFCWGDDLGLQFLKNGIYNITLADYYVYHDQSIKSKYGVPENSYRAAKSGNLYYFSSHDAHYEIWKNKWGFDRNWQVLYDKIPNEV